MFIALELFIAKTKLVNWFCIWILLDQKTKITVHYVRKLLLQGSLSSTLKIMKFCKLKSYNSGHHSVLSFSP